MGGWSWQVFKTVKKNLYPYITFFLFSSFDRFHIPNSAFCYFVFGQKRVRVMCGGEKSYAPDLVKHAKGKGKYFPPRIGLITTL